MSTPTSEPGWHPDPTGAHQSRYYNNGWTEHVADNGVQSVSPMPVAVSPPVGGASPPAADANVKARRGKGKWVIGGVAAVAVVAVVGALMSGSSDDSDTADGSGSGVDTKQSFCDDFSGTWGIVSAGMITAETLMFRVDNEPTFSGGTTDDLNSVTQAAQNASVIAAEAPDDIRAKIVAMSDFLNLAIQLAQGDTSVVGQMTSLNISSEDSAWLSGTVPLDKCAGN